MFNGKSVFVSGGTGSFGRKFAKILLERYDLARLVFYSRDELKQFEMQQEVNAPCIRWLIGDVRDGARLIEATRGIDYLVHAAAMKQVTASEYNPMECIRTNIHGAENIVAAALANNVELVVALSSDKAANPINLYGATKLASDKLFIAANNMAGKRRTAFSVVRYGNVAGSRGSVVPFFEKLIAQGATSLPITDIAMTRFWISLQQSVDFVLKCFQRMQGGEIFVPKLPSIRIVDLATAMAPHLPQNLIGIRPGEKLHEILCPADNSHLTLEFSDHYVMRPTIKFYDRGYDYLENRLGETGAPVARGFEYNSGTNPVLYSVEQIREFYERTKA
ncbi:MULTISPECIES: UDP-N-acetylglucosamine 4,6-dehydratase (inverting) [unclassified Nitrobacter]|uniref:UDP-N-acetylglucosamine 4,6-dehydratase (inverting) n=1 Tax=unclassified Nitrobacter TaxID=2620411 RepID=UPI000929CC66|nr:MULTISPECIES: UDP-N-acetylglucosamine 4,6-dehydratase (inverting) [unclassified Nitrobacter]MBN9147960.1 UDP-N-acetylglucosamine 4,6-dehydratase (inverting) [Nitrobacter sp.]MBN9489878.1 UDP-N-acetylglucosamine 4,6-dehydratase (inverting) [Alphaproteobacteria bacterium]OJV01449.1 MAG: UDP-N-acetylglucosamine 4,6-dehydratase (inverting) [Nitrobacter sp. 62-23]